MKTLIKYFILFSVLFSCENFLSQIQNIKISSQFDPEEVTIAINPKNTNQIIAGSNLASSYYSHNAGYTWQRNSLICKDFNVYGDPVVFWDTTQAAYFMHLSNPNPKTTPNGSWVDRIVVNKSTDFGLSYPDCFAFGKNNKKVQDKHWACVDEKTNTIHVAWTQFDVYESSDPKDTSIIRYSNSKDGGVTWAEPKKISAFTGDCKDNDNTVEGAVPCMGPNGEVYIAWAGPRGLVFQKSLNGGASFLPQEKIIAPIKNGWEYKVNEVSRANGLPFTACDISNGPNRGRVYVCWGDEKNGETNKDVFIVYSDDKGETWSDPIIVTYRPNHKEQFMPFMTIDQKTGFVYVLYYDRQNYLDDVTTDVYLAVSKNGALKFDYYKINEASFKPDKKVFFGDYIGISAVNNVIRPIWMQMDESKILSIYTAIINDSVLSNYQKKQVPEIKMEKMTKFLPKIKINYSVESAGVISAAITKPLEPGFEKVVAKDVRIKKGANQLIINTRKLSLKKGNYVVTLYYNGKNDYVWITEE
ncbi:MAG: sialidase family protein [Bacteroidota bacterium]|nr:sialidase family protein [Bacteroidota bacterium]MDP3146760.1 sialidase family protein [Bacteroidota bacterium]